MSTKSKKGFTLVEIMIVVVIIGLLAAMAIPAFSKVRQQSREKAVTNNLRQIASAGQQYILEEGEQSITYSGLTPTYFASIATVAGENYTTLTVDQEGGGLKVTIAGGTEIVYTY